jgi:exopolysaccharide biosynthesis polyprenyl glycosylphosphotransferase
MSRNITFVGYGSRFMGRSMSPAVDPETQTRSPTPAFPVREGAEVTWPSSTSRLWRHVVLRRVLACADVTAGLVAGLSLVYSSGDQAVYLAWGLAYLPAWILVAKLLGLYDRDEAVLRHLTVDEVPRLVLWALVGTSGLALFLELTPAGGLHASSTIAAGLVAVAAVVPLRALARWAWRRLTPPERVALVGSRKTADAFKRKLELFPDLHMAVVEQRDAIDSYRFDTTPLADVDRIVLAPAVLSDEEIGEVARFTRAAGLLLTVVPPRHGVFGHPLRLSRLAELSILDYGKVDLSQSTLVLKRGLDVATSAVTLVLLLPLLAAIALAVKLDDRGPVFFSQWRAGRNGRPFRMHKVRTMVEDAEAILPQLVRLDELPEPVFKLQHDPRVTRVGRLLRRWSLDELPQLVNVLRGEMSLVGPRPEQVEVVERYSPEQCLRLLVKPGLTGPMQVYGRGELGLAERLTVERDYIENLTLGRDVRILGMTISAVIKGKGAF